MVSPTDNGIRVIVIDDHPVALAGIRLGLKKFDDIRIEEEALDGESGSRWIAEHKPDVAVIDVLLPDMDGVEVARRARASSPETRLIVTSGSLSVITMSHALTRGVDGFFPKSDPIDKLAMLIRRVMNGGSSDAEWLRMPEPTRRLASMTQRENAMLILLATGSSLKQAANRMDVSDKVADDIKQSMMRKLNIHDRVDMARFAIREHLVSDSDETSALDHHL